MVSVGVEDWRALMTVRPDLAGEPLVAGWADAGHPLVARRPALGDEPGSIALGLPLPPAHGKRRIAISLPPGAIAQIAPPPLLQETACVVPDDWRPAIAALIKLDPGIRVFGSLAWEHLTGLAYLTQASDLDLLWDLPEPDQVEPLLASIAEIAQGAPMRIDGEIRAHGGDANWTELMSGGEVLVKDSTGVGLMARNTFLARGRP
jgi:phosphoribosyl-dephospho-CoA transferase